MQAPNCGMNLSAHCKPINLIFAQYLHILNSANINCTIFAQSKIWTLSYFWLILHSQITIILAMKKLILIITLLFLGFSSISAETVTISVKDVYWNKGKRSPARLPQVTIEGNELTIYLLGEAEDVSIEVYDDCQNPVANNTYQGDEMIVTFNLTALESNQCYYLYLSIDDISYIGEFCF